MAKKSKKKTIASTRPSPETAQPEVKHGKKKKLFRKIFVKKEKLAKEKKVAIVEEAAPAEVAPVKPPPVEAKSIEAKPEKPKKERKRLTPEQKQKIRGGALVLIGLFALTFIGWFLFGKVFRPQYLAEILPASDTIGVLELNIDGANGQPQQFYKLMEKYPVYQKEGLVKLLTLVLPLDFAKDVEPWLGRRAGMAMVTGASGSLERLYFVESRDHNLTLEFLKGKAVQEAKEEIVAADYSGFKVYGYTLSHAFEFTFLNNYLVIAENPDTLKKVLDAYVSGTARLNDDADYRKVANNLPQGGLIFGYAHMQKLFDALTRDEKFVARKGQDFMAFKPFLSVFTAQGVSVFANGEKFNIQTFTSLNKDALQGGNYITYSEKYQGNLLSLANPEPILIAGGHDLTKELNRLEEIFKGGTKTSALIFNGLLEAQKEQYLGKEISLKEDVYPLLQGEYLLTVENNFEKPQIMLLLELVDKNNDLQRLEKIVAAFVKTSGIFSPRIQEVTLPDGTKGQEIVASSETVERFEENYNGVKLTTLRLGNTGWAVSYASVGNRVVAGTGKDSVKNIIDRSEGRINGGFTATPFFAKMVQPVLRTADEVYSFKLGALTEALGLNENEILKPYLLPFASLTSTRNYFEDGISTIYLLEVI